LLFSTKKNCFKVQHQTAEVLSSLTDVLQLSAACIWTAKIAGL